VSVNVTDAPGTGFPIVATRTAGACSGLAGRRCLRIYADAQQLGRDITGATRRKQDRTARQPLEVAVSVFCPTSVPSRQLPTLATPAVSVTADPLARCRRPKPGKEHGHARHGY